MYDFDRRLPHDPATCSREHCGRCRPAAEANPPKPVDHQVQPHRAPKGRRELDLGRHAQQIGRRIEDEGQAASQHFYEWEREARVAADSTRGGGNGGASYDDALREQAEDRQASAHRARWLKAQVRLESVLTEIGWLLDQAQAVSASLESKHRTAAQVEADGWCGNCWRHAGQLVPISQRPSGEPYYKGRCRGCGAWPDGDPPAEVVNQRLAGKAVRVKAS